MCQRSGINIDAHDVRMWARWPTCAVNAMCVVSANRKCVCDIRDND